MNRTLFTFIFVVFLNSPAVAQNSLGDGNALDSNTSPLSSIDPQRYLPSGVSNSEIRKNNVLQGRGFNEGIGRDDGNTAGMRLLSDAANAGSSEYIDALYNSPWYWNNWDQQSAQFLSQGDHSYFNPNFIDNWATSPGQMSSGRNIRTYSHEWSEDSARKYGGAEEAEYPDDWSKRLVNQYKLGQVLGSGTMQESLDTSPVPVGIHRTNESLGYLAASPMIGVSLETTELPTSALGFSAWDAARLAEDNAAGLGDQQLIQPWRTKENRLERVAVNSQVDVSAQYNQVLQRIAERSTDEGIVTADNSSDIVWLENQYLLLQNELAGIPFYGDEDKNDANAEALVTQKQEDLEKVAIEDLGAVLRHGERISRFSGVQQTRFDELVQLGELELKKKNYFTAERRFNQALQFIPGHPLATAGLAHAKIGAGLYLSAGYVLQSLLSFQPEMIDVEYDEQLLPPRIDLVRAAVTVRNRLDIERDAGTYGFLLAYIGHQLHDQEMVEQGLATLKIYTDANDPITPLLQRIWFDQEFISEDSE